MKNAVRTLLVLLAVLFSNCSATRNYKSLDTSDIAPSSVPPIDSWKADRDKFINSIKGYVDKNKRVSKSARRWSNFLTISTSVVGLGGGMYGLFNENEPKGPAVTSLVGGALTGFIGSLKLDKRSERATFCNQFLNDMIIRFSSDWGDTDYPQTLEEFRNYKNAKNAIATLLIENKCYGED
jgi:hypothetical protein